MAGRGSRASRGGSRTAEAPRSFPAQAAEVVGFEDEPQGGGMIVADRTVAVAAMAETQTQEVRGAMLLAKEFPRSEDDARDRILRTCGHPGFAEKVHYSYPRGTTTIKGISIVGAREMARAWGNIRNGVVIVSDDDTHRTLQAFAWDMESNEYISAQDTFKKLAQRKFGDVTKWVTVDERDLRELTSRRASLLLRNCILAVLPWTLKNEVSETATATMENKAAKDPDAARRSVVDGFSSVNVPIKELEDYIGHAVASCSPKELEDLRTIWRAIKEGETQWADYIRPIKDKATADAATASMFTGAKGREVERPGSDPKPAATPTGDRRAFLPPDLRMPTTYAGSEAEYLLDVVAKTNRMEDVNAVAVYLGAADHFGARDRIALLKACSARTGDLATPMDADRGAGDVPFAPPVEQKPDEPKLPPEAMEAIRAMRKHPKAAMALKVAYQTRWLNILKDRPELVPHTDAVEKVYLELMAKAE